MQGRWFSKRALGLHAALAVVIPAFVTLCVWQVHRAVDGNDLSWAYVFEWPFFAGYAIYLWWKLVHEEGGRAIEDRSDRALGHDADGEELDAYNRYLEELQTSGRRKRW